MSSEKIVIPLSKTKLLLGIVGSFLFVILGNWLIVNAEVVSSTFSNGTIMGMGLLCVFFFTGTAIIGLIKIFSKKTGLQIDEHGITDNSNASSLGLIEWQDIISFRIEQVMSSKFIIIDIQNQEKYLDRVPNWKKRLLKANIIKYSSPVTITSNTLKIDSQELIQLLNQKLNSRN